MKEQRRWRGQVSLESEEGVFLAISSLSLMHGGLGGRVTVVRPAPRGDDQALKVRTTTFPLPVLLKRGAVMSPPPLRGGGPEKRLRRGGTTPTPFSSALPWLQIVSSVAAAAAAADKEPRNPIPDGKEREGVKKERGREGTKQFAC